MDRLGFAVGRAQQVRIDHPSQSQSQSLPHVHHGRPSQQARSSPAAPRPCPAHCSYVAALAAVQNSKVRRQCLRVV